MEVPFLDLGRESRELEDELTTAFREVVRSGRFLWGVQLEGLEQELAARHGVCHAIGVGSGSQALQVMLLAHGIGAGDEVVTTPASFYATAKAIQLTGAVPVFADIDPDNYNLDPAAAEAAITSRTKALLVVHLYGRPAALAELRAVADRHRVPLLEDAAQAFGASIDGRPVGTWGESAILSFYPTKNIGALGDSGAMLTSLDGVAQRARSIRSLGYSGRRDHFDPDGISGRMDEVQAALLRVKLRHVEQWLWRRRALARRYQEELPDSLLRPPAPVGVVDTHHLFVVRSGRRDELAACLARQSIGTEIHYRVPLHQQPLFYRPGQILPVTERWAREVLSLPLSPSLRDDEQSLVIEAVRAFESVA